MRDSTKRPESAAAQAAFSFDEPRQLSDVYDDDEQDPVHTLEFVEQAEALDRALREQSF